MGHLDEERNGKFEPWMAKNDLDAWLKSKPEDLREAYRFLGPEADTWYGSVLPLKYGPTEGGTERLRTALPQILRAPLLGLLDLAAATKSGELTPEALEFLTMIPLGVGGLLAPGGALAIGGARRALPRGVELPSLRGRQVDEAIQLARQEPHLIESGSGSAGGYVGGPSNVKTYADLEANRLRVDRGIEAGAEGANWYKRARANINEVTGGDPVANEWMSHQHGVLSGGVKPENELAAALRENNASIAGMPDKALRQWQHDARMRAVENKDPGYYPLGDKTGPYQKHIEPSPPGANFDPHNTATGVTDFRAAREHGYADPHNLDASQHRFIDYENALAVDRARRARLGGRSDWTGEEVQAAGWVNQKKDSILQRQPSILRDRLDAVERRVAAEGLTLSEKNALIAQARAEADAEAFSIANRTIGDSYDKHMAYDIHPLLPGEKVPGHMPGVTSADVTTKAAYAADPRSTWATAPGGRDAIYAGTGIPGTGVSLRVRPTTAVPETSAEVGRPLVAFRTEGRNKIMPDADRALLDTASFARGAIDAQPGGYVIKTWDGGDIGKSNAVRFALDRPLTAFEKREITQRMEKHGFPVVDDTGTGVVASNFGGGRLDSSRLNAVRKDIQEVLPNADPIHTRAELVDNNLEMLFAKGKGSGAVTDELLAKLSSNPVRREAFDQNQYLPGTARARAERDQEWSGVFGAPRQDVQNLRGIVGDGPGWVGRLEEARRTGSVSLPSHVPVPVAPAVRGNPLVTGDAGLPSFVSMPVDDLPKMNEARMAEQARELIGQSVIDRARRQREEWLRKNPPPVRNYLIRRDLIA